MKIDKTFAGKTVSVRGRWDIMLSNVKEKKTRDLQTNPLQEALYRSLTPENMAVLVENIRTLGQLNPLLVRGNVIIDGHQRHFAARQLNMESMDCIEVLSPSPMPNELEKILMMSVNEIRRGGEYDRKFRIDFYQNNPRIRRLLDQPFRPGRPSIANGKELESLGKIIYEESNGRIPLTTSKNDITMIRKEKQRDRDRRESKSGSVPFKILTRSFDKRKHEVRVKCANEETARLIEAAIVRLENKK